MFSADSFILWIKFIIIALIAFTMLKIVVKTSYRVVKYLLVNSISGLVMLVILRFIGFGIELSAKNIIIASVFGLPGLIGNSLIGF